MKQYCLATIALLLMSCVTVEQDVDVGCQVQPVDAAWDPVVAPFYFRDRVELFQKSLQESSSDIEVVDSAELWETIFSDRDPDADVQASEFRHSDISIRILGLGIRHLVVLDAEPETTVGEGVFAIVYNTQTEVSTHGAVLLTFTGASCDMESYLARAEGRDHVGWIYLGYMFDADTPGEALRAITDRMAETMLEQAPERPIKVVVVATRP